MPGSGPFGERIAIDWLELCAGTPILLAASYLLLTLLNSRHMPASFERAGAVMMGAALVAAVTYVVGMTGVYTGLFWDGLAADRMPENLLASLLFFGQGLLVSRLPRLKVRMEQWLDR